MDRAASALTHVFDAPWRWKSPIGIGLAAVGFASLSPPYGSAYAARLERARGIEPLYEAWEARRISTLSIG